jgi:heat shock protein HslJ
MGRRAAVLTLVSAFALGALAACADSDSGGSGDASAAVTTSPSKAAASAGATDAVGTWGKSTTAGEAYLTLAKDGSASGSDGCNQLSGTWKAGDDGISFSPWAATQMYCADVDPWLSLSASGQVQGDELVLFDENNTQIGTLQRTS